MYCGLIMQQKPDQLVHGDENFDGVRFVVTGEKQDDVNKQLQEQQDMKKRNERRFKKSFLVYLYSHGDTWSLFWWFTPAHWT